MNDINYIRDLSPAEQRLLRRMQQIRFGKITNLIMKDGQPVFQVGKTKATKIIQMRGENRPRPATSASTHLKADQIIFFRELRLLGDGCVREISIVDGVPKHMDIDFDLNGEI